MKFSENNLWREETEILNLKLSKLARAKVLLKLEFDTEDQVLFISVFLSYTAMCCNAKYHNKTEQVSTSPYTQTQCLQLVRGCMSGLVGSYSEASV